MLHGYTQEVSDRQEADNNLQEQITNNDNKFETWKATDYAQHVEAYNQLKSDYDALKADYDDFKSKVTAALTLTTL